MSEVACDSSISTPSYDSAPPPTRSEPQATKLPSRSCRKEVSPLVLATVSAFVNTHLNRRLSHAHSGNARSRVIGCSAALKNTRSVGWKVLPAKRLMLNQIPDHQCSQKSLAWRIPSIRLSTTLDRVCRFKGLRITVLTEYRSVAYPKVTARQPAWTAHRSGGLHTSSQCEIACKQRKGWHWLVEGASASALTF